jgi:DNA-binding CsgD family transcriptional regulator
MERTVRSHADTIKAKLGVSRKREIPAAMRRFGLLEP